MGTLPLWTGFCIFVLAAIALDLGVFHRRPHKVGAREAMLWSVIWISLAALFGLGVLHWYGKQHALEFFTGYIIEKSLSVDNLFIFLVIFRTFRVDDTLQQRVLGWGILGALILRAILIAAGAVLIGRFHWILYIFGTFLTYAGLHMLFAKKSGEHPERNPLFHFASMHLRVTREPRGRKFFVWENGKLYATPLFLVLLVVEITDVTFALDSIPAIFGITRDTFIVFTSNVFAILGLRALYFLLASVLDRFRYLTTGLAVVLAFIGVKMLIEPWVEISVTVSLGVVAGALGIALLASSLTSRREKTLAA